MSLPVERPLKFEIRLPSSHPQLLEGLDIWLGLGLISDTQVRQLCREFLVCAVVLQPQAEAETKVAFVTSDPVQELPIAALESSSRRQPQQRPALPNFISTMLQSLGAELSVRWLLFLGVFLVVVSSGVLAASQWERFPASGQYGVLFAYTLIFWGLSFWATRQNNLRLTAQTLLIVTLLLVPVNFWAMDSFRLWQNPVDWIVVAIAWPTLTAITVLLYKNRTIFANLHTGILPLANILGLSYLHWGWQVPGFPLIAVYVAMIGTTIMTVYHNLYQQPNPISAEDGSDVYDGLRLRGRLSISLPAAVVIYALIVLLVRAIFVARVDVMQLGLAIGICGWLVTWLAQRPAGEAEEVTVIFSPSPTSPSSPSSPSSLLLWERLGGILLFLGWLVSVVDYPWQAIAVSGLGLWFVGNRLRRHSLKVDLAAVFVIGLQTICLGWRLVPDNLQKLAIATGTQLTNSQNEPGVLLSIALFPYVVLMVALTDSLYRRQKQELAKFGELLTLLFGAFLTTIALINPTLRSLNLLFSTTTLAFVTQRRSPSSLPLVYLTHIIGVLTFCSTINWLLPSLSQQAWASILLALMVAEWGFSLSNGLWRRSASDIGLGLAAASFFLLWMNAESSWYGVADTTAYWGVIWLVTPLALTGVANCTIIERRTTSRYLSVLAMGVAQLLTLQLPGIRLIGLAVGAGLMFANTRYLRNQISAIITEGFVLSFIGALLWTGVPGLPRLALA
ncbi:MAG: glycosyltransferase family protein, partial [Nostoc sp.]